VKVRGDEVEKRKESFTEMKTRVLGFRVKSHSGLFIRFAHPNSFEEQNQPSTTILQGKRDHDHEKAQKRPLAWSEHGRLPETRKVVRPYAPAHDLDYTDSNYLMLLWTESLPPYIILHR
jgi:hypothetical protein